MDTIDRIVDALAKQKKDSWNRYLDQRIEFLYKGSEPVEVEFYDPATWKSYERKIGPDSPLFAYAVLVSEVNKKLLKLNRHFGLFFYEHEHGVSIDLVSTWSHERDYAWAKVLACSEDQTLRIFFRNLRESYNAFIG